MTDEPEKKSATKKAATGKKTTKPVRKVSTGAWWKSIAKPKEEAAETAPAEAKKWSS